MTESLNNSINNCEIEEIEEEFWRGPETEIEAYWRNPETECYEQKIKSRKRRKSKTNQPIRHRPLIRDFIVNYQFNHETEGPICPPNSPVNSRVNSPVNSRSSSRPVSPTTSYRVDDSDLENAGIRPRSSSDSGPRSGSDSGPRSDSGQVHFEHPEPETCCGRWFQKCSNFMRIKKGFLSETLLSNWKLDSSIEVDLHNHSMLKRNQIRRLKYLVKNNRAYSLYYYQRGLFWKRVYWISNLIGLALTGGMTIVNMLYNPCSANPNPSNPQYSYNVILGAVITTGLGIIAFTDASSRRRQYEDAGDEYKVLAIDIYREAFFSNQPFQDRDLNEIIDEYSIRMEAYSKIYEEPPLREILKILEQPEFDMNIEFIS